MVINYFTHIRLDRKNKQGVSHDLATHAIHSLKVNIDACRALVALLDRDGTGRLSETDFHRIWDILRVWSRLFATYDPQRTGFVTSLDFRIIVEQAGGYTLSFH